MLLIQAIDVDKKFIAKILAKRLEYILPDHISVDQTGFILGHNSCNSVRRLLNLIQYSTKLKAKAVIVSLDIEKAFNRVKRPYLLSVFPRFNLRDNFIKCQKVLSEEI